MLRFTVILAFMLPLNSVETLAQTHPVPVNSELTERWNEGEFTEGVAVGADGRVFFSDIATDPEKPGRILSYNPRTMLTTVVVPDSRKSNGLYFDSDGRLLACCGANGGARALCEVTLNGRILPLVERFEGKRLNSPNDLVIHPSGAVYFSDPRYIGPEPVELDHQSLYRYHLATRKLERVTTPIEKPNGVQLSPDGRTLYVAETNNGSTGQTADEKPRPGRMTLNAFDLDVTGHLSNHRVLVDFGDQLGIDGMAVDSAGNIYAAVRSPKRFGIMVYSPTGRELAAIKTPVRPTNCCFGVGEQSTTLYITAGGGLYETVLSDTLNRAD